MRHGELAFFSIGWLEFGVRPQPYFAWAGRKGATSVHWPRGATLRNILLDRLLLGFKPKRYLPAMKVHLISATRAERLFKLAEDRLAAR